MIYVGRIVIKFSASLYCQYFPADLAAQIQDEFELLLTKTPGKTPPEEIDGLRKKIEEEQALLIQWAEEKVQLALTGHELLDAQMGQLEGDLIAFKEELAEQGIEVDTGYVVDDYPMDMAAPETAARRGASRMQFPSYESLDPAASLEPRTGGRKSTQIPLSISRQQSGYGSEGYATGSDMLGWEAPSKRGGGGGGVGGGGAPGVGGSNRRSNVAEGYGSRRRAASAAVHATAAAVAALDDDDGLYGAVPAPTDLAVVKYADLEPFVPGLLSAAKQPQAPGRPLTEEDIGPNLVGCVAEVFWPDEADPEGSSWYLVKIESVDMQSKTASIRYQNGEMEPTLSLLEVAKEQHMMLINMGS